MIRALALAGAILTAGCAAGGDPGPRATTEGAGVPARMMEINGVEALLLVPPRPVGSLILLPGGNGELGLEADGSFQHELGNQLVRTRLNYVARGFAVLLPEPDVDLAAAVGTMAAIGRPVTVVATSRGTQRAAWGIAHGARPDRLVLTSGFLSDASGDGENVVNLVKYPAALPPTLVIHHRYDTCHFTRPEGVAPFLDWAGGRARIVWLEGGRSVGKACKADAYHGFNGLDDEVVAIIAGFAAGGR